VSFDQLGLSPELLRAVADEGYTEPTPVQREAIPHVLAGRDLLAGAQTGTGKTAAFVLPIIQYLHRTRAAAPSGATGNRPAPGAAQSSRRAPATSRPPVRVLVMVPTRELAIQVEESVRTYGAHRPIRSTTVYGGVGFEPQAAKLRAGPEIVVATPGRLLDHVGQRTIDLSRVEVLVLDEADRMLDMGFIHDIRKVLALLPPRRQNLLFSATFSDDVRAMATGLLHNPASVQVTPRNTTAELVAQVVHPVDRESKRALLAHLVTSGRIRTALVFTRTKHGANRLAEQLGRDGINAMAIHGNKSQSQRVKALTDFKAGKVAILVATDIAARGLDIDALPHVVNYELPMVPEDYVHRIGRTGRAGVDGEAISLVCVDEQPLLGAIQQLLRRPIRTEDIPGFEPDRSVRPQPIRLRSTPAERAEYAAARGGGSPSRGTAPSRGGAPARGASPSRPGAQSSRGGAQPPRGAQPSRGGAPSRDGRRPGRSSAPTVAGSTIGRIVPGAAAPPRGSRSQAPGARGGGGGYGQPRPAGGFGHPRPGTPRQLPGERLARAERSA
jgi:ATP-dependent RNA helicase RhlE